MEWLNNLRKLACGRQAWRADDEYAYYGITDGMVKAHAANQIALGRECYYGGMQILRSMGLLDRMLLEGKNILDIGAGECFLAQALSSCGAANVVAVDAVPKQMWAAALLSREGRPMEFLIADAIRTPYEESSFDLVVGNLILHHIEPLDTLLAEIRRLLAPGGAFFAIEPAPVVGTLIHDRTSKNEAPIWPGFVAAQMRASGFESVKTKYWWTRLQTGRLGLFSPGYIVKGRVPGGPAKATPRLARPLLPTTLPGLSLDSECSFGDLAVRQLEELRQSWHRTDKPKEWEQAFRPW